MLLERFQYIAKAMPGNTAFIQKERCVTYGELVQWTARIADYLSGCIEPGETVAILMENSPEYAAAVYGVWAAGGVVVGLNTGLKANDLALLISHSEARCLVADRANRELSALLGKASPEHLVISGDISGERRPAFPDSVRYGQLEEICSREYIHSPSAEPGWIAEADHPAMIIYTSGTTGNPKGVMLSHANLDTNIRAIQTYLPIEPEDRALCVLPFFYSYGNSLLHSHLASGAALILENSLMYPQKVLESLVAHRASAFYGVPSSYYLFLSRTDLSQYDLSSLRYCAQAGGAMDKAKINDWRERVPADFYVMYGQTEASARLTYLPPSQLDNKAGSVGVPIPGVEIKIRGEQGHWLGVGETGEVCARGDNVMMGYFKAPEETKAAIHDGWLLTGDLGYLDSDGYLYLAGRSREMIKSGAHRINPREIEEVIASVDGVQEVAVVGSPDDLMGQVVSAFVIATDPSGDTRKAILRQCKLSLANYKLPKSVEFVASLPKTASGKVQKHKLIAIK